MSTFKLRDVLSEESLAKLAQFETNKSRILKEGNNMKLKDAVIQAEDMTPEIGKKIKRDDLGKYGRKGWEKEVKVSGEKAKNEADKFLAEAAAKKTKKETDADLQSVDKDADVSGPIRRWAEPTKLTTIVKEAEDLCKKDDGCKKKGDEDAGTMGVEPKIAETLRRAEEDMTAEIGKKVKRDDLGAYGRKGWEKKIKVDGEAPKKESKLLGLVTEMEGK